MKNTQVEYSLAKRLGTRSVPDFGALAQFAN
jgi:hypothetical protein